MKATELMQGDIVLYEYKGERFTAVVREIYNESVLVEEIALVYEPVEIPMQDIYSIPLTPEILEKNGFDFIKNDNTKSVWNGWWIYEGLELATACLNKKDNWPCFINIYDSNIKCEYVHQLQHALRLCGIEKEIAL